jgi:hypothetical protein
MKGRKGMKLNGAALGYELRVLGLWLFAIPLLVGGGLGGLAVLLDARGVSRDFLAHLFTATLEACLPLALGILLATVAAQDAAIELQLSVATPYRRTALRRFALLLVWTALIEAATMLCVSLVLPWAAPKQGMDAVLLWLAPLLWLASAGALLALLLQSRITAGAVLGGIWIAQLALHSFFASSAWLQPWFLVATLAVPSADFWRTNRVELLLTAVVLFVVVWYYLRHAEWRFRGEET